METMNLPTDLLYKSVPRWTFREDEWFLVASDTLRERYNRALEAICHRRTLLTSFHIDMTGFSPEVAEEFNDAFYLNPHGINRRFILLVPEQKDLIVRAPMFSWTADVMHSFMEENWNELFSLMAREAVFGEFENSIYRLESIQEILDLKTIALSLDTPNRVIDAARALHEKIGNIGEDPENWLDDNRLNELVSLAVRTGDIRRHPVIPLKNQYNLRHFYTHHFGGVYRFDHGRRVVVLTVDPELRALGLGDADIQHHRLSDSEQVRRYLTERRLVRYQENREELKEQFRGFLLDIHVRENPGTDFAALDENAEKHLIHKYWDALPELAKVILTAIRHLEQGIPMGDEQAAGSAFFLLVEPKGGEMAPLIHHLLANFRAHHYRYLYRWNRALFWQQYALWPGAKQEYVSRYITRFGD